jgi:hypothetical protein
MHAAGSKLLVIVRGTHDNDIVMLLSAVLQGNVFEGNGGPGIIVFGAEGVQVHFQQRAG